MLRRKTSTPASKSLRIMSGVSEAGPSVAMILTLRRRFTLYSCSNLLCRSGRSVFGMSLLYYAKTVDVGVPRSRRHEIAQLAVDGVRCVAFWHCLGIEPPLSRLLRCIRRNDRARRGDRRARSAVDPVG